MNKTLNVIKCISAFCVIVIHCVTSVYEEYVSILEAIIRVAVPIFVIISGYYSYFGDKSVDVFEKYKKRAIKIGKLIIITWIIYFIYKWIAIYPGDSFVQVISNVYNNNSIFALVVLNIEPLAWHSWFLYALLYCYILMLISTKYNINVNVFYKYIPVLLLLNIILGELSSLVSINIESSYSRNFLLYALPYFLIGYAIHEKNLYNKISNKSLIITSILSIILIIIERRATGRYNMYIGNIFLSIAICILGIKNPNALKCKNLEWIGRNIYTHIYILHLVIVWILEMIEKNNGIVPSKIWYINSIIVFVVTAIISICIYYINKILKKCYSNFNNKLLKERGKT